MRGAAAGRRLLLKGESHGLFTEGSRPRRSGIGDYDELEDVLPDDYRPLLDPLETMRGLYGAKRLIEDRLCQELNLTHGAGPADHRLGEWRERLPRPRRLAHSVRFHIANDHGQNPIDAEVVQAATKWKRIALAPSSGSAPARAS